MGTGTVPSLYTRRLNQNKSYFPETEKVKEMSISQHKGDCLFWRKSFFNRSL